MQSVEDLLKTKEIMCHVSTLFDLYEEQESFFEEYIDGVLKKDIEKSLLCFRDLVASAKRMKIGEKRNAQ